MGRFSFARFMAMLGKELTQMRRDPGTIAMTVILPLVQLTLFGTAINTNPKHLPTAILSADHSAYERSITAAMANTGYFDLRVFDSERAVDQALERGEVLFALHIPPDFARAIDRGERPELLVEADATDATAVGAASAALTAIFPGIITRQLPPNLQTVAPAPAFQLTIHDRYNPEQITALTIVPGLIGTILSFSTLLITTLAITREREGGTMENLLSMPIRPVEIMLGKIVPYIGLGYVQTALILVVAVYFFRVPIHGSVPLLLVALGVFIACNLGVGFTFSTMARTQMQANQMAQFALLPQLLLSGFLFPFAGMPGWAQAIGEVLPLTHIVRICRGILLKGNDVGDIFADLWPMGVFAVVVGVIAVRSFRQTLD